MMKDRALTLIALSALTAVRWAQADDDVSINNNNQCRIYLAPSTSAGPLHPLGVYSGVEIQNGEAIGNPDIGIPFIDATVHSPTGLESDRIFWMASEGLSYEDQDYEQGLSMMPGIGFAGSNNPPIVDGGRPNNAEWDKRWVMDRFRRVRDTGTLDARTDPGAGAASEYFDLMMKATDRIRPGEEILPAIYPDNAPPADGGQSDQESREKAQQVVDQFAELTRKHSDYFTPEKSGEVWDLLMNDVVTSEVKSLLPSTAEDARRLAESENSIAEGTAAEARRGMRSMAWLEENGQCMDNLEQAPSAISMAGRGAFSKRFIPKGGLVAPGPLVRFSRDNMNMFRIDEDGEKTDEVVGKQLMINYCFGHRDSSVLLFPIGSTTAFINHNSFSPNVEVRWSTAPSHRASMLGLSAEELANEDIFGLMFDFVATRDITRGEEVFMDYGPDWERAWKEHTASWGPPEGPSAEGAPTASALNDENSFFRTLEEQGDAPYPDTVRTHCSTFHQTDYKGEEDYNAYDMDTSALEEKGAGDDGASKIDVRKWMQVSKGSEEECDVIGREMYGEGGNKPVYVVRMKSSKLYMKNVPHRAITFGDVPYASPMHWSGVFRHEISIPDDIFPESWKDLRSE